MSRAKINQIDKIIGRNIRVYRLMKRMSQTELADAIDLTFQQVQKYELGMNRVGCARLIEIAAVLGVHFNALFEGTGATKPADAASFPLLEKIAEPQSMRLMQAFAEIDDSKIRQSIVHLVESIASSA
jgi:transcriptional regulator with XRE-family HTH domain